MTIHLSALALILLGSGVLAAFIGVLMVGTFDVSEWLPPLGMLLAICGVICVPVALVIQIGAWVHG